VNTLKTISELIFDFIKTDNKTYFTALKQSNSPTKEAFFEKDIMEVARKLGFSVRKNTANSSNKETYPDLTLINTINNYRAILCEVKLPWSKLMENQKSAFRDKKVPVYVLHNWEEAVIMFETELLDCAKSKSITFNNL